MHFLDEFTLRGKKETVYILMKILKFITCSPAKSYEIKFGIFQQLSYMDDDEIELGSAIRRVMKHLTIRNKFGSGNEKLGIARVEVLDDGFKFVKAEGQYKVIQILNSSITMN